MSLVGQVVQVVEGKLKELAAAFTERDDAQDKRLDAVEKRLDALEKPTTAKATASPTRTTKATGTK